MPPAISDDESSEADVAVPVRGGRGGRTSKSAEIKDDESIEDMNGAGDENDDDDEGDEDEDEEGDLDEDVFIVESVKKHMVDEEGNLKFQVKWEGWDSKKDLTWEPEENLKESAHEILDAYFDKIGGRKAIMEQSEKAAKGKKRGRPSSGTPTAVGKRSRKNGTHPANAAPSATAKKWAPPAGSWEDDIESIDACEDDESSGKLVVYLVWKGGYKTKHDTNVIYKKCPQKMLQFYERHVKIIRDENKALAES